MSKIGKVRCDAQCDEKIVFEIHAETKAVGRRLFSSFVDMAFVIFFSIRTAAHLPTNFADGIFVKANEHFYFYRGKQPIF